jgi:hypothetical protein
VHLVIVEILTVGSLEKMSEESNLVCAKCGKKANGAVEMWHNHPICDDCIFQ